MGMFFSWFRSHTPGVRALEDRDNAFAASSDTQGADCSEKRSRFQTAKWPLKWSLKLRDRISHSLSFRKSTPLSEGSDTRIGVHRPSGVRAREQPPDDWDHGTSASTAESNDLTHPQYSVTLQPATSAGSYYTADSYQSAASISRSEDPLQQQEDDEAPDPFTHSVNGHKITSSQKNTQAQLHVFSIPAVPDSDPPASPVLRSSEFPNSRDNHLWQSFLQLRQVDRWLAAGEKLREVEDAGMGGADWVKAMGMSAQQKGAVREVTDMVQSMACFEQSVSETCGYKQNSSKPLQMFYRPPVHGQTHNIRAVSDFAVKAVEVLALAREFDLVKSWNWTASDSAILETRSEFDMDALAVLKMPWPYKHRFAAFRFKGGDFLDERGCVAAFFDSCLPVRPLQEGSKPPGAENAEEVRILNGSGVSIEPCWTTEGGETVEGCRVYIQKNIDPLMAFVPAVIINFVLMVISPGVYRLAKWVIHSCVRKPGTKLHERMKERGAFYDRVESRVQQYLASQLVDEPYFTRP